MINSRLWEILVTFYQCGTLSAAAEKLYASQPSLSAAMKQLEKELGVTLFERSKNRITLNEIGLEAAKLAQNHLKQEESMIQHLQQLDWRRRTVTVASFVSGLRKQLVADLSQLFPDRSIVSEHLASDLLLSGLLQGRFDYIITEFPIIEEAVTCVPYITDKLLIRVHKEDKLASREAVTFKDLQDSKLLVWLESGFWAVFIRKYLSNKLPLIFINGEQEYRDLIWAFHMRSFTLSSFVSELEVPTNYRYVPLDEENCQITFYLSCLEKNKPYLQTLLNRHADA